MKLIRHRKSMELPTLGTLFVYQGEEELCVVETLELPWKENQRNISCIPEGEYEIKKRHSKKFKEHFHITGVPGRSWILIHVANFVRELRGCIAPGEIHTDIDKDGIIDVGSSGLAMHKLLKAVQSNEKFKITIL